MLFLTPNPGNRRLQLEHFTYVLWAEMLVIAGILAVLLMVAVL